MLQVGEIWTYYGKRPALNGVSIHAGRGEIVGVVGPNGMGKTTLIKSILGLLKPQAGVIEFDGVRIDGLEANRIARLGVAYVPQDRGVFPEFTVDENLEIGATARRVDGPFPGDAVEEFLSLVPRRGQRAGTLSGGEAKILSIGRAALRRPRLLLLDEPTENLMPTVVRRVAALVSLVGQAGTTVVMAEQNIKVVADTCDRVYVLEPGRIKTELTSRGDELRGVLSGMLSGLA